MGFISDRILNRIFILNPGIIINAMFFFLSGHNKNVLTGREQGVSASNKWFYEQENVNVC